ncbi:MAG: type II toxin-antitoxin system RelE/ParE family toxin [Muribaculaceae bacterium]|nr:type II toxin-antitoxin system RelE/ParE family toxin [Muribaculaceae bacterium]
MEIVFNKEYLSELYYNGKCSDKKHRYQQSIVKRYIRVIDILESVGSIEDLYRFHSLHYESLVGDLKGFESVRVGDKYRLIFKSTKMDSNPVITICNIEDLTNHYQ